MKLKMNSKLILIVGIGVLLIAGVFFITKNNIYEDIKVDLTTCKISDTCDCDTIINIKKFNPNQKVVFINEDCYEKIN